MKNKFIFPLALSATLPALANEAAQGVKNENKPNIIVIYCDDLGYGDLGITGHPDIATPHLDKMALQGLRFTNYYSASPASTASRYSLLTGKYPQRAGFGWVLYPDAKEGIHPHELTMAEAIKEQGYATAIFGKWHLGSTKKEYLPLQNGFDEYLGLPYSNDMDPPKFQDIALMQNNDTLSMNPDQRQLTELYTARAKEFMQKQSSIAKPFFVYLPYAMPHTPLHPGEKFVGSSKRGTYGDVVQEIDHYVDDLLKSLDEMDIAQNTIVWFMSDNGPWILRKQEGGSAGLFRDGKGSTWEGGMRVPCFVYWKGKIAPNGVNNSIVNAMDVYATNIYLAGGKLPTDRVVDGQNIVSYLLPQSQVEDKKEVPFFYHGINNKLMAVRYKQWKLHVETYSQIGADYFGGKLPLLFDIYSDPSEKYDLAAQHPQIVEQLTELITVQKQNLIDEGTFWDRDRSLLE